MNRFLIFFSMIISVILVVVCMYLFRADILKTNSPDFMKTIVQIVMPPKDLYEELVVEVIGISFIPTDKRVTVSHKYYGDYEVQIIFAESNVNLLNINSSIDCKADNGALYSGLSYEGRSFVGRHGNGFSLLSYNVPKDVPLEVPVVCNISILRLDAESVVNYGEAKLVLRRRSNI